jgi:hypothetical protein
VTDQGVVVTVNREGILWSATLPVVLGRWVVAWLAECRVWSEEHRRVFAGRKGGALTPPAIWRAVARYREDAQ